MRGAVAQTLSSTRGNFMNLQRIAVVSTLVFGSIVLSTAVQAQGESGAKTLTSSEIKYGQSPTLPKGAKSVVLMGDPKQGAYVNRVQLAANVKIMPHSHPTENLVTVLSGTVLYGEGDKFDPAKLKAYPAGSFIVEKPNLPHYMTAKGPAVFQVSVPGKSGFDYVDPKDDPRKK
jgi:quercetin dioxygenase-like cupin family protein